MNFPSDFINPCDNRKIHDGSNKAEILQWAFPLIKISFIIAIRGKNDFSTGSLHSVSQPHS